MKILAPWLAGEPGFAERFSREARVLAKLNHPNIVTLHDFGQAARFFYLLMEYVDGVNLRQAMQAGRFTPEQALGLVPKICDALQYAHGEGVLHRDIKPDNILLDAKGRVKIADFGIAKLAGETELPSTLTRSGMQLGTPAYMAPELMVNPGSVDHRADICSLGVVLYEMLTGELPLGRFAAPSEKSAVDGRIDEIVFRTLAKERECRYQSADEMKTKVEGLGATPVPPTSMPATAAMGPEPLVKRTLYGAICSAVSPISTLILILATWMASWIRVAPGTSPPDAPRRMKARTKPGCGFATSTVYPDCRNVPRSASAATATAVSSSWKCPRPLKTAANPAAGAERLPRRHSCPGCALTPAIAALRARNLLAAYFGYGLVALGPAVLPQFADEGGNCLLRDHRFIDPRPEALGLEVMEGPTR